jgi:hypothetical protein
MVMPSYLAVDVGPGEHAIVFRYGASTGRHALQLLGVLVFASFAVNDEQRRRALRALDALQRRARL